MSQRQPRIEDPAYLAYVRTLPCLVCGRTPCDAAHIRSASLAHGKRLTGMAEKPDDRWAVPLCREHHMAQHAMNELEWWASKGIDPFKAATALYASRPNADKPVVYRKKPSVKLKGRSFSQTTRKIPQRVKT